MGEVLISIGTFLDSVCGVLSQRSGISTHKSDEIRMPEIERNTLLGILIEIIEKY